MSHTEPPSAQVVIYSGDGLTADQLADNAFQAFSIRLKHDFKVGRAQKHSMLGASQAPGPDILYKSRHK